MNMNSDPSSELLASQQRRGSRKSSASAENGRGQSSRGGVRSRSREGRSSRSGSRNKQRSSSRSKQRSPSQHRSSSKLRSRRRSSIDRMAARIDGSPPPVAAHDSETAHNSQRSSEHDAMVAAVVEAALSRSGLPKSSPANNPVPNGFDDASVWSVQLDAAPEVEPRVSPRPAKPVTENPIKLASSTAAVPLEKEVSTTQHVPNETELKPAATHATRRVSNTTTRNGAADPADPASPQPACPKPTQSPKGTPPTAVAPTQPHVEPAKSPASAIRRARSVRSPARSPPTSLGLRLRLYSAQARVRGVVCAARLCDSWDDIKRSLLRSLQRAQAIELPSTMDATSPTFDVSKCQVLLLPAGDEVFDADGLRDDDKLFVHPGPEPFNECSLQQHGRSHAGTASAAPTTTDHQGTGKLSVETGRRAATSLARPEGEGQGVQGAVPQGDATLVSSQSFYNHRQPGQYKVGSGEGPLSHLQEGSAVAVSARHRANRTLALDEAMAAAHAYDDMPLSPSGDGLFPEHLNGRGIHAGDGIGTAKGISRLASPSAGATLLARPFRTFVSGTQEDIPLSSRARQRHVSPAAQSPSQQSALPIRHMTGGRSGNRPEVVFSQPPPTTNSAMRHLPSGVAVNMASLAGAASFRGGHPGGIAHMPSELFDSEALFRKDAPLPLGPSLQASADHLMRANTGSSTFGVDAAGFPAPRSSIGRTTAPQEVVDTMRAISQDASGRQQATASRAASRFKRATSRLMAMQRFNETAKSAAAASREHQGTAAPPYPSFHSIRSLNSSADRTLSERCGAPCRSGGCCTRMCLWCRCVGCAYRCSRYCDSRSKSLASRRMNSESAMSIGTHTSRAMHGRKSTAARTMDEYIKEVTNMYQYNNAREGEEEKVPWHIVHPESTFRITWDILMLLLVIWFGFMIPLRIGFELEVTGVEAWFDITADVLFLLDIGLNFRTAFKEDGVLVTDSGTIAKLYLQGWFMIDFLASFPIGWIIGDGAGSVNKLFRMLRLFKLFRMLRLLKLFPKLFQMLETSIKFNPSVIRFFRSIVVMLMIWHCIACSYWYVAREEYGGVEPCTAPGEPERLCYVNLCLCNTTAVEDFIVLPSTDVSWYDPNYRDMWVPPPTMPQYGLGPQYWQALFWAVQVTTGIGNDIIPKTQTEVMFTVLMTIVGLMLYSIIIGSASSALANMDSTTAQRRQTIDKVTSYMRGRKVPSFFQKIIIDFYDHMWSTPSKESDVFADLPDTLRSRLTVVMNRDLIDRIPIFQLLSAEVYIALMQRLTHNTFLPGEHVIRRGFPGERMYFIKRGKVDAILPDGHTVFATYKPGNFFGENALLYNLHHNASYRSVDFLDVLVMERDVFDYLRVAAPEVIHEVRMVDALRQQRRLEVEVAEASVLQRGQGGTPGSRIVSATDRNGSGSARPWGWLKRVVKSRVQDHELSKSHSKPGGKGSGTLKDLIDQLMEGRDVQSADSVSRQHTRNSKRSAVHPAQRSSGRSQTVMRDSHADRDDNESTGSTPSHPATGGNKSDDDRPINRARARRHSAPDKPVDVYGNIARAVVGSQQDVLHAARQADVTPGVSHRDGDESTPSPARLQPRLRSGPASGSFGRPSAPMGSSTSVSPAVVGQDEQREGHRNPLEQGSEEPLRQPHGAHHQSHRGGRQRRTSDVESVDSAEARDYVSDQLLPSLAAGTARRSISRCNSDASFMTDDGNVGSERVGSELHTVGSHNLLLGERGFIFRQGDGRTLFEATAESPTTARRRGRSRHESEDP